MALFNYPLIITDLGERKENLRICTKQKAFIGNRGGGGEFLVKNRLTFQEGTNEIYWVGSLSSADQVIPGQVVKGHISRRS